MKVCSAIFVFFILTCCVRAYAQADSSARSYREKAIPFIGGGLQYGFILAHSQAVQNTKGANPSGLELTIGTQKNDAATWDLCHCYPRRGLLLAYYDYDTKILGRSYSAAYFLEPVYRLRKNLFFSFRGSAGLSYLSNPYDSIRNPTNQSYSSHASGYLMVGLGLMIRLSDQWWLHPSINYQHESNGGLRQPNKGINWPTAGIAVNYQKTERPFYTDKYTREKFRGPSPLRWDVALFGIARRVLYGGRSRRVPMIGLALQGSRQVGRINALTAGMEAYRDEELRLRLRNDALQGSAVKAGLLAGHEFLLGRMSFSQRIGIYVFDQTPYYDRLYHRWGLHYRVNRIGFGMNLQAHRHVADFVDLRMSYTFGNKRNE